MRIGIDCRKIEDFGIGTYVQGLLAGFAENGLRDTLILFGPPNVESFVPRSLTIERIRVDAPHYSLRELVAVGRDARRARLDVFHAPHYVVPFVSGPVVATIHDLIHLKHPSANPLKPFYARRMIGRAVRRSAAIATVTEAVAADIREAFPAAAEKIEVVPNGVLPSFFSERHPDDEAAVRALGLRADGYLLFVGNDKPHKDLETLAAAWRRVRADLPSVELAIAGSRPERLRGEERVRAFGWVDAETLAVLHRCALALVQPSRAEGFGLPVAEAMASGTPVVCSDIPPLREVAGEAARYVPAGDPAALHDAILGVARSAPTRDAMIRAGRERARAFTWSAAARRTAAIYRRAARADSWIGNDDRIE